MHARNATAVAMNRLGRCVMALASLGTPVIELVVALVGEGRTLGVVVLSCRPPVATAQLEGCWEGEGSGASFVCGRYWDRTNDLFGVNEALSR